MLFDTSFAEAALDALLAFSYHTPDMASIILGEFRTERPMRKYEMHRAIRELQKTVAAVSKLERKVAQLQTRLRGHVAVMNNAYSPTPVLPAELLYEIFKMVADSDASSKARIVLSHVSRRWREIAIAIPELWTVIETGPDHRRTADMLREFSRRAGSLELHVSNTRTYRDLPKDSDLDHKFAARCTKISLLGDVSYSALRSLIPRGYHCDTIRELVLEAPQHDSMNAPVFEFGEGLRACRILHLRGVQLSDDGYYLPLIVLHVSNMMIQDFHNVVCELHCEHLEELYVANIVVDDYEEELAQYHSEAIGAGLDALKALKHFGIKDCTPKVLNIILNNWTKPLPSSLDISPGRIPPDDDSMAFSVVLLNLLVSIKRSLLARMHTNIQLFITRPIARKN